MGIKNCGPVEHEMTWNFECLSQQDRAPCRLQLWSTTRIQLMQKSLLLYCTDAYVYDVVGVTQIDLHIPKPVFGHLDLKLAWEMSLSVGARLRANAATCLHVSRCLESLQERGAPFRRHVRLHTLAQSSVPAWRLHASGLCP